MRWFNKEEKFDYILFFDRFSRYSVDAARYLQQVLTHFDQFSLEEQVQSMHEIEKAADQEKKKMLEHLIDEFLPPIDKEDIIDLSHKIDDVTDGIEEVLVAFYTHGIKEVPKEALVFAELIQEATISMNQCLISFQQYKKSDALFDHISKVNRIKSEAEKHYKITIAGLFQTEEGRDLAYAHAEIYKSMRLCYLLCKAVTNSVEKIVMKNI